MKIIKLDAIDSTNSFLKELNKDSSLENFTIAVTKNQQKGRGQRDANWYSEPFKNLTFSVLVNELKLKTNEAKYINFAVSLAIFKVLEIYKIPNLFIKWPNDIMSANKKICGILIENSLSNNKINNSIIGIGLNVNQVNFPNLERVSSLNNILGYELNLDDLLIDLIKQLKFQFELLNKKLFSNLENEYLAVLYKKDIPSMFKTDKGITFLGKIIGIATNGNLLVESENNGVEEFAIKEISFL
uniref:biotin--[acetyl-CoA-carboxylase] ligase n=1 Tax=uncultured Polaribacter sp. TaxID=174711 RepID=UPI00262252E5|nr:biotin--[acetyl-CoA-carboxylase] ligase [uncultured Polaribacter sp.]